MYYSLPWDYPNAAKYLSICMAEYIYSGMIVTCIGSVICPGDSLGPRVGTILEKNGLAAVIQGTMEKPIHAQNLDFELGMNTHLALDACVSKDVGFISFATKPILPGASCGKDLPPVGKVRLTGTVCQSTEELFIKGKISMEFICNMATVMANAVCCALALREALTSRETAA